MRALTNGALALTPSFAVHLDRCLACRACERACPSNVGYGEMVRAARSIIRDRRPALLRPGWRERVARRLFDPESGGTLRGLVHFYQRTGLDRLTRRSGLLKIPGLSALENDLPAFSPPSPWQKIYPVTGVRRGAVALFTGCVSECADRPTLYAAIRLLTHIGFDVHVPSSQTCCGALHQHSGDTDAATALARRNLDAFADDRFSAIIGVASGCTAALTEYARDPALDAAPAFSAKVRDIAAFLVETPAVTSLTFKPLTKRIAVHDPCTTTNVLRNADKTYALLRRISGAEIVPLPENQVCCGAGGAYHLRQPEMARLLRADKIAHLRQLAPDILVTSNIGCGLFLAAGLREAGIDIEVLHPIALLARQLQD